MQRRRFAVEFAAFVVVLGIPDGALGVLWPGLRTTFHRPVGDLGVVALAGTVLYLIGGVVYGRLAKRLANPTLVVCSCAAAAVSAAVWAVAGAWALVLVTFGAFGLGRGVLDAAVNADASDDIKRLGWLHAGWSVGGAGGPLLVAGLAHVGSWRLPVAVVAAAATAVSLVRPTPHRIDDTTARPPAVAARVSVRKVSLVLAAFATYTAAEIGPCSWAYIYFTDHRRLGSTGAAFVVASFWVALTVGRIALGVAGQRLEPGALLLSCSGALCITLLVVWLGSLPVAIVALPLTGLACAAMFPVLVHVTPVLVGVEAGNHTIGLAIAAAAVGGPLAVLIEGRIADAHGVGSLAPALFVAALPLLLVTVVLARVHAAVRAPARSLDV